MILLLLACVGPVDPDAGCRGTAGCDGAVDTAIGDADTGCEESSWYADNDGDGFGAAATLVASCDAPPGSVATAGDCDDTDPLVNPGAQERCDGAGVDEDCDGAIDGADPSVDLSELPTWHIDADADGFGDPEGATLVQCDAPIGYSLVDQDCDDTDPAVNPGATEVCGNGVDDNCNGGGDGCGLSGSYQVERDSDVSIEGWTKANLGYTVCGGADLNDDGRDDLVAGWPGMRAAVVLFGGARGSLDYSTVDGVMYGDRGSESRFGSACALGDFNGDGVSDVAVSDPRYAPSGADGIPGRVYVALWPLELPVTFELAITNESSAISQAGTSLASGDWSGDGVDDLIIGAGWGDVVMELGPVGSGDVSMFEINEFEASISYYGSVASGGDVDGDGADDLVVTDPIGTGTATVVVGGFGGTSLDLARRAEATISSSALGSAAVLDGDLNGDGYDDVIVSAPSLDQGAGAVYGCFGPLSGDLVGAACDLVISGAAEYGGFGTDVAYVGDENGDGQTDILVGAPQMEGVSPGSGVAYLFRGPLVGAKGAADAEATFNGEATGDMLGAAVSAAGDFNGDGDDDLLISAYGAKADEGMVYVMFGGDL